MLVTGHGLEKSQYMQTMVYYVASKKIKLQIKLSKRYDTKGYIL